MKCPLSNYLLKHLYGENDILLRDCLEEECAWWVKNNNRCCIPDGAFSLDVLLDILHELVGKMPHERQFRK